MPLSPDDWSRFVRDLRPLLADLIGNGANVALCSRTTHNCLRHALYAYEAYLFEPQDDPELKEVKIERIYHVPLEVREGHPEGVLTIVADTWSADLRPRRME